MIRKFYPYLVLSVAPLFFLSSACSSPEGDRAKNAELEGRPISPYFVGLNLSYFNDLDVVWENYDIPGKLMQMDARILRYPGGEETSRWHWNMPGLNGYVDLWNEEKHQYKWQSTWVPPEEWETNEAFMSIDEYFEHCIAMGVEPLLGVNMTSGEVNDRREDGIQMAVDMIRHVKEKGYPLRYVYLDNEPWHRGSSNYYFFPDDDYAKLCVLYVDAIREVMPDLKFVANPFEQNQSRTQSRVQRFFEIAGNHIDIISVHLYWETGRADFNKWADQKPMLASNQWREMETTLTFVQDLKNLQRSIHNLGFDNVELAVLEWNPSGLRNEDPVPNGWQRALIQGEMLMQFLEAEVVMTSMWPMLWQVVPPENTGFTNTPRPRPDNFLPRGILEKQSPFNTTPTHDMFMLFRGVSGGSLLGAEFKPAGQYIQNIQLRDGSRIVLILNKSDSAYELDADILKGMGPDLLIEQIDKNQTRGIRASANNSVAVPPFSLSRIQSSSAR